jgi:hypothetical protein
MLQSVYWCSGWTKVIAVRALLFRARLRIRAMIIFLMAQYMYCVVDGCCSELVILTRTQDVDEMALSVPTVCSLSGDPVGSASPPHFLPAGWFQRLISMRAACEISNTVFENLLSPSRKKTIE